MPDESYHKRAVEFGEALKVLVEKHQIWPRYDDYFGRVELDDLLGYDDYTDYLRRLAWVIEDERKRVAGSDTPTHTKVSSESRA